jgi:hypothetical protein
MKYGQIVESKKINDYIYQCFRYLEESEIEKFVREFKDQPHDKAQVVHTFRELILGAYLSKSDFRVSHDYEIDGKTPDWCILDGNLLPQCIIELVNFHPDAETSSDIVSQISQSGIWCNFQKPNTERLYHVVWDKASKYKSLARKYDLPYVVSVFGVFTAAVELEELDECLLDTEAGLFKMYSELSGLLYFEESFGVYHFSYICNPFADFITEISSGKFCIGSSVGPNPASS